MKEITVNASVPYRILIGSRLLRNAGALCRETVGDCRLCIVTDDTVNALYADTLQHSLSEAGYESLKFVFPHGETSKNIHTLNQLLEFCADNRLTRSDCMIALGGGVTGDLTGFAAAVYLRGIRFIQIPTTLLAAVDSSVGGKTGIDLQAGKNLAGAFHQPSLVICDHDTLHTLPDAVYADGCAEVIKYGVINDRSLFELLKRGIRENTEAVIASCVQNKSRIVEEDEKDKGTRQLLNLGHTVGHAIEQCSDYRISHGNAVAMGMAIICRAAVRFALCPETDCRELEAMLCQYGLPIETDFGAKELAAVASADKKRAGDTITLVIPCGIGNSRLMSYPVEDLEEWIGKGLASL